MAVISKTSDINYFNQTDSSEQPFPSLFVANVFSYLQAMKQSLNRVGLRYANANILDFDVNVSMVNMTFSPIVFDNFHQTLFFVEKIGLQTVEVNNNHNLS